MTAKLKDTIDHLHSKENSSLLNFYKVYVRIKFEQEYTMVDDIEIYYL